MKRGEGKGCSSPGDPALPSSPGTGLQGPSLLRLRPCGPCSQLRDPIDSRTLLNTVTAPAGLQLGKALPGEGALTGDPGCPEREAGERASPEKEALGSGPPCSEELSSLNLRCSHRCVARVRAGHLVSLPGKLWVGFYSCLSTQKLLKASGGAHPIYPRA